MVFGSCILIETCRHLVEGGPIVTSRRAVILWQQPVAAEQQHGPGHIPYMIYAMGTPVQSC
jgi:hypothetical protein